MKNKKDSFQFFVKCSVCNQDFKQENLMVLEENQQQSIFHALCPNCKTATMIFLSSTHSGLVSLGMATDLNQEEAKKFFGQEAVNVDEVIDVHSLLFKDKK
jgi:ribosomal protein S27E